MNRIRNNCSESVTSEGRGPTEMSVKPTFLQRRMSSLEILPSSFFLRILKVNEFAF